MADAAQRDPWFLCPHDGGGAAMRLVCFPFAGGGASIFRGWSARFAPAGVEIRPVQLPGRETRMREPLESDLLTLAGRVSDALLPYVDRPVAFFGYSFGGLLAFEVARELRRRSLPGPCHLFIAATTAPQRPRLLPPMAHLTGAAFIAAVDRYFAPTDEAWKHPELVELLAPVLRNDIAAVETYTYQDEPPLSCPLHVHVGDSDHVVPLADAEAWRAQTSAAFDLTRYPGGHFFLHEAAADLQQRILDDLSGQPPRQGNGVPPP